MVAAAQNPNEPPAPADQAKSTLSAPLVNSGSLDHIAFKETTPAIGRIYSGIQIADWLTLPQDEGDRFIRDFAQTVSLRGVVFLREQKLPHAQMKELITRMSRLSGSPESSELHVHPLTEESSELGDQVAVISAAKQRKGGGLTMMNDDRSRFASNGWHSDITFERVPSDYACLLLHTLPASGGGDTLWASGTAAYQRLSSHMQQFLTTLTATHDAKFFHEEARRLGQPIRSGKRGNDWNGGESLEAVHPIIRTNPVTGLKSIFVNKGFTRRINEVNKEESDMILNYLFSIVTHNHDIQTRFNWEPHSIAIWDNRCTWHTATYDVSPDEERAGDRVSTCGERPYL